MAMNDAHAARRLRAALLLAAASAAVAGCYSTSGGYYPHTDGGFTYESTSMQPTTITILNNCERSADHPNGTPFFIMEIPPGKQLTFNFEEDGGRGVHCHFFGNPTGSSPVPRRSRPGARSW